jgi:predicted metal-dependent HD superfamily phosphohydrolase
MNNLIEEISVYINDLFETKLNPDFVYHNLQHTKDVVDAGLEIAEGTGITKEDKELVLIAAWFHDSGYSKSIKDHEEISAKIAENFLKERNYPEDKIDIIKQIILSTKIPQNPKTQFEKVLCDADLAYIGSERLMQRNELLRKEWQKTLNKTYSDLEWIKQNIDFINSNRFHTEYAKKTLGESRVKNLSELNKMLHELEKRNP